MFYQTGPNAQAQPVANYMSINTDLYLKSLVSKIVGKFNNVMIRGKVFIWY